MFDSIADEKKKTLLAISANVFEWYEYVVFAFLGKYIGVLFFYSQGDKDAVLFTFSALAAGYLARPVGALYFGMVSDRKGVSETIFKAMILMAAPTILLLISPTYDDAGILSSLLLVTLRLVQGFAAGAELPLMAVHAYNTGGKEHRKILCAFVNASSLLGVLVASLVMFLFHTLFTDEEMLDGAWRYPFALGLPVFIMIFYARQKVFSSGWQVHREVRKMKLIKDNLPSLIEGFLIVSSLQVSFYILFVWYADYLRVFLGVPQDITVIIRLFSLCVLFLVVFLSGFFLSRFDNYVLLRNVFLAVICITPLVFIMVVERPSIFNLMVGALAFSLPVGTLSAMTFSYLNELFDVSCRGLGVTCSFTLASVFIGGFSPVLAMKLIEVTGDYMMPAYLILVVYGISGVTIFLTKHK